MPGYFYMRLNNHDLLVEHGHLLLQAMHFRRAFVEFLLFGHHPQFQGIDNALICRIATG